MKTSSDESLPARPGGTSADAPPDDPSVPAADRPHAAGEGSAAGEGTPATSAQGRCAGTGDPRPREIGGQAGPEPTRYGDWEKKGRCTDF